MTIAVKPAHVKRFMVLSAEHAVESAIIGEYTDTGKLRIKYKEETCAYVDMDLLEKGFSSWEFDVVWIPPETRRWHLNRASDSSLSHDDMTLGVKLFKNGVDHIKSEFLIADCEGVCWEPLLIA